MRKRMKSRFIADFSILSFPAIVSTTQVLLLESNSAGVDKDIISISDILNLIPGTK